MAEYKTVVKKANPTFDPDYYDSLILGEPQTLAPKDPVRFEQVDPIGTVQPSEITTDQPSSQLA